MMLWVRSPLFKHGPWSYATLSSTTPICESGRIRELALPSQEGVDYVCLAMFMLVVGDINCLQIKDLKQKADTELPIMNITVRRCKPDLVCSLAAEMVH